MPPVVRGTPDGAFDLQGGAGRTVSLSAGPRAGGRVTGPGPGFPHRAVREQRPGPRRFSQRRFEIQHALKPLRSQTRTTHTRETQLSRACSRERHMRDCREPRVSLHERRLSTHRTSRSAAAPCARSHSLATPRTTPLWGCSRLCRLAPSCSRLDGQRVLEPSLPTALTRSCRRCCRRRRHEAAMVAVELLAMVALTRTRVADWASGRWGHCSDVKHGAQ